jgi:hypothetical protein
MDSVESSFRRCKSISNVIDWQTGLLTALLHDENGKPLPAESLDMRQVCGIVANMDKGSVQLAWETSTGLSNIQLKRRDVAISKLSSTVPEEHKQALRASGLCGPDLFERHLVKAADAAFQEATQRKATLTLLGAKTTSAAKTSTPWTASSQQKPSASHAPSSKRKRGKGAGGGEQKKRTPNQGPHASAPAKRGGGRGGQPK